MEIAGLEVVMGANFDAFYSALSQADTMMRNFAQNFKSAFSGIPDFGKKFNFTSNGASQAAQDAREYARAAREQAAADIDAAKARALNNKETERQENRAKNLKDEWSQLLAENQRLTREYYNASASLLKYGDASGITAQKLEELRKAALESNKQISKVEQGVGRFQRNVGNYASGFNPLSNSISQIARELPSLSNGVAVFASAIGNNLFAPFDAVRQIVEQNKILIAQGQPVQSVFKQLASSIFSFQTALAVGVTLLTVYGPKIYDFIKSGGKSAAVIKDQEERQKALNEAYNSGLRQAGEQITTIKRLNDTMTNTNLTMEVRTAAYNEAVKLYPSYLSGISKEDALSGALADTINNKLIPAIQSAAKARAIQNKITTLAEQEIDLRTKVGNAIDKQAKAQSDADKVWDKSGITWAKTGDILSGVLTGGYKSVAADISNAKEEVQDYTKAIIDNVVEQQKLARQLQDQMKSNGNLDTSGRDVTTIKQPKSKIPENLEDDRLRIAKIYEKQQEDISNAEGRIIDIREQAYQHAKIVSDQFVALSNSQKDAQARALDAQIQIVSEKYKKSREQLEAYRDEVKRVTEGIRAFLTDAFANMAVQSAELIGETLAKIGDKDWNIGMLFKDIGKMLGDQIIALGKQLVIAGGLMEAIWKAISAIGIPTGGAAAIIVGLGAIAAGAALKAALSKQAKGVGQTAFADGGVVYGPTNALIGEYSGARSNPEVVAPLDKLKSILSQQNFGGNKTQVFIPEVTIKGQDLVIAFDRAQTYRKR